MQTQTLDLKKMGLVNMEEYRLQETNGGVILLGGLTWTWFAQQAISNWDDIKKGLVDGWNSLK